MDGVSLLQILIWEAWILIWVHYKGMWIKNLRICPIRIEIIYGRGKFVGDFNMGSIICANLTQIMLPIFAQIMLPMLKSPTNLPLP